MPPASRLLRCTLLGTLITLAATSAPAQTTEAGLAARLKGKPLYLRGSWVQDKLDFDADGKPLNPYKSLPFTEAGFDFKSARWVGDQIVITGTRMALGFDEKGSMKRIKIHMSGYSGIVTVTIQAPAGADCTRAVDAVFASDLADLTPSLPSYWQTYAKAHFLPHGTAATAVIDNAANKNSQDSAPRKVRANVHPPKVLTSAQPAFTQVAKSLQFSGDVQVSLRVEEDGIPSHLEISRPAGLGLDEAALVAVQAYRFSPATADGVPVKVDLYIDVNFRIF